jgi:cell division septum initiation protein DivIVA
VQAVSFRSAHLGRRGFDEEHVRAFCHQVQDELVRLLSERAALQEEVNRLRRRILGHPGEDDGFGCGGTDAHLQSVNILYRAQQTADHYVAEAQEYSRHLARDAQRRRDDMLAEAHAHANRVIDEAHHQAGQAAQAAMAAEMTLAAQTAIATQAGRATQPARSPHSGRPPQPGAPTRSAMPTQSGMTAHPVPPAHPATPANPATPAQRATGAHPATPAQRGTAAHRGTAAQPGTAAESGVADPSRGSSPAGPAASDAEPHPPPTRQEREAELAYLQSFSDVYRTHLRAYLDALIRDVNHFEPADEPPAAATRTDLPRQPSPPFPDTTAT